MTKPCKKAEAHHWVIDAGVGNLFRGTCKHCGKRRKFIPDATNGTGKQQFAIRPSKYEQPIARVSPGYWSWTNEERLKRVI